MMTGEFVVEGRIVHDFDQIQARAVTALRKERLGFVLLVRDNVAFEEGTPMHAQTAFAARGSSQQELRDFLEMVIEFAERELEEIDALES